MKWSKFVIADIQILGATVRNFVAQATLLPAFVHPLMYTIWKASVSIRSPRIATVCFATIQNNDGFEKKGHKHKKQYKFSKMRNYKYRMWCKETAQLIRNESYPHLPYKLIRDMADQITKIRDAMSRKTGAVKPSEYENVLKKSKRQDHQPGTLSQKHNLCISPRSKNINAGALQWRLKTFGLGFEHTK